MHLILDDSSTSGVKYSKLSLILLVDEVDGLSMYDVGDAAGIVSSVSFSSHADISANCILIKVRHFDLILSSFTINLTKFSAKTVVTHCSSFCRVDISPATLSLTHLAKVVKFET